MTETVIDAGAVLDERERQSGGGEAQPEGAEKKIDGERGSAELKAARRTWPAGARTFFIITGLVMAGVVTLLLVKARRVQAENQPQKSAPQAERIAKTVPDLKLSAPTAPRATRVRGVPSSEPASVLTGSGSQPPSEAKLVQQRRLARGFGGGDADSASGLGGGPQAPSPTAAVGSAPTAAGLLGPGAKHAGGVEEKLEAVELKAASAGMLPERDYLLTQGAMLDCVLETKLISTVSGMSSCHLTRDIYSTNGRVVLLDRGSKVVGRYQGGMQQGEARIFVVWTRVETPNGVVIELQSPGTGALGEAGLGGYIDTHFWDRFGSAILLSIIQDGADAAAARAAGPGANNTITFSNQATAAKEVVAKSMEPTLNIPPTLYKNQGERVGIFVARDLDFRSVYGLEPTARADR
jgi:type IV secretion system protein VirB10